MHSQKQKYIKEIQQSGKFVIKCEVCYPTHRQTDIINPWDFTNRVISEWNLAQGHVAYDSRSLAAHRQHSYVYMYIQKHYNNKINIWQVDFLRLNEGQVRLPVEQLALCDACYSVHARCEHNTPLCWFNVAQDWTRPCLIKQIITAPLYRYIIRHA